MWRPTLAAMAALAATYFVGAFIAADFNSAHWEGAFRGFMAFIGVVAGICAAAIACIPEIARQ